MTHTLEHRGPDDFGFGFVGRDQHCLWKEKTPAPFQTAGVAMGHRRLSILDLSVGGRQPFVTADHRYWLVYNGEIYNYLELRTELSNLGYHFRTTTDTEVLLTAYIHWGLDCLNRFNGMWAFVLWDNGTQTLFASRDRFGIKPLYYHQAQGEWFFASEIKALLKHPKVPCEPDKQSVYHFMSITLYPPTEENTFFKDIKSLKPGSYLLIRQGKVDRNQYWRLPLYTFPASPSKDRSAEAFAELFKDAVRIRLRSDVKVGTMLSGGLDSTSIVRFIHELLTEQVEDAGSVGGSLSAFTASFPGTAMDESDKVKALGQQFGLTIFETFPAREDVDDLFSEVVYHMEMPFARSTQIVQTLLMQQAHKAGIKVVLNGHGADEMLAGYPDRYCALVAADAFLKFNWRQGLNEVRGMRCHGIGWPKTAFAALGILQPALASFLKDALRPGYKGLFRADLKQQYPSSHWRVRDKATPGKTALHRRLQQEYFWELVPVWLCMEDKVSMSASIESRLPFLDYRLVEFVFALGDVGKINGGVTKYILREAMRDRLPDSIVSERKKLPFSGPVDDWLRNAFRSTIQTTLFDSTPRIAEFVNLPELRRRLSEFLSHGYGDTRLIWKILNTEIWMRAFFQR